jgi:putative transposase fregment
VEEYKKTYPISAILDCFGVKRSTFYRLKKGSKKPEKRDEMVEKIEQLCMQNQFIYGYRTITQLLKKIHSLVVK